METMTSPDTERSLAALIKAASDYEDTRGRDGTSLKAVAAADAMRDAARALQDAIERDEDDWRVNHPPVDDGIAPYEWDK